MVVFGVMSGLWSLEVVMPQDRGQARMGWGVRMSPARSWAATRTAGSPLSWPLVLKSVEPDQAQRKSVSESHKRWSSTASLRATATRARLVPLVSASLRPQSLRAQGRLTRPMRTLAAS